MPKLALTAGVIASTAVAFTLGALTVHGGTATITAAPPNVVISPDSNTSQTPDNTSQTPDNTPQTPDNTSQTPDSTPQTPSSTPATSPSTLPAPIETPANQPSTPKPSPTPTETPAEQTVRAGSKGPLRDAEDDGKWSDDAVHWLIPGLPELVPGEWWPFPGDVCVPEQGCYPYEPEWGDDPEDAANPGVVCDPILAENLGVPLADSCDTGHSPADTWARTAA